MRQMPVLKDLRGRRHWLLFVLGGIVLALIPWTAYLSATLPGEHVAHHWDIAWAGFDVFEVIALAATLIALARRSPRLPLFAAIAGTTLLWDAWFDVITANRGSEPNARRYVSWVRSSASAGLVRWARNRHTSA